MSSQRQFYIEGVALSTIGCFGLIGNGLGTVYFGRKHRLKKRFYSLMFTLSVIDVLLIISFIWFCSVPEFLHTQKHNHRWSIILFPLINILCTISIYLTLAVSFERYLAICKPLFYHEHLWHVKVFLIPIFIFSILYNIPTMFELHWMVGSGKVNGTNITVNYGAFPTELRLNSKYEEIYKLWGDTIILTIIPIIILIILNTFIFKEMKRYKNYQSGNVSEEVTRQVQVHMAEINLIIVGIFLLCHTFRQIPTFHHVFYHKKNYFSSANKCNYKELIYSITEISQLAVVFNSSIPFYVYSFKSWLFRNK